MDKPLLYIKLTVFVVNYLILLDHAEDVRAGGKVDWALLRFLAVFDACGTVAIAGMDKVITLKWYSQSPPRLSHCVQQL